MQDMLESMGLTRYEARALADLVRHGMRTGPALSRDAEIPFGRVYDTLNSLVDRGLVHVEPGRPKQFKAVPSKTIPGRLLAASERRMQAELGSMERHSRDLARLLDDLHPTTDPGGAYGIRLGEASAREFLIEATLEARQSVSAMLSFDKIHDEDLAIFDAFRQAVGRGVKTRILLRASDIDYLLTTPYVDDVLDAMLPHLGQNLDVRLSWEATGMPFATLDRERAMLGVKNPLDEEVYFAVVHVDDAVFSQGLEGRFDALWEQAEEPSELIQWALGKKGGKALVKFGAKMRRR